MDEFSDLVDFDGDAIRASGTPKSVNSDSTPTFTAINKEMGPPALTPGSSAKKRKTSAKSSDDGYEADTTPTKKTKGTPASRQRKTSAKTPNKAHSLAASYDLCAEHDKMLIDMRDSGESWADIRKAWEEKTGDATATSTLPNRYSRLKSNFVVIKEEDNPKLIEARREIEAEFEKEKWALMVDRIVKKGGEKYKPDAVRRQYKILLKLGEELTAGTPGGDGEEEMEE